MKTYQQMAESVLARRDQYVVQQKERRKKLLPILPCAGLVLLAGIGIWRGNVFSSGGTPQGPIAGTPATTAPATALPAEPDSLDEADGGLIVNWSNTGSSGSADIDAISTDYDNLPAEEWDTVSQAFTDASGFSYEDFVRRIPDALRKDLSFYGFSTRKYTDGVASEGYYPHDYILQCTGEGESSVTIALCPDEWPLRCVRVITEDMKQSWVHGTPVTVIGLNSTFYVRYEYRGAFYDIETRDVSQADLETLLNSLLAP